MDDRAEIVARLDRSGALASDGAGRSTLLREVRGLLEEGERHLRAGPNASGPGTEGGPGASGLPPAASPPASAPAGEEANVT